MTELRRKAVACNTCGSIFQAKKDHGVWQKFCNRYCFEHQENHPITIDCLQCGCKFKSYYMSDKKKHQKHCSKTCYNKTMYQRTTVQCTNCNKEFDPPKWKTNENRNEYFCSVSCYAETHKGENSHAYKSGSYICEASRHRMVALSTPTRVRGWKGEHREVAAKALGRPLHYHSEPILHINGIKDDNRPENLYVCTNFSEMRKIYNNELLWPMKSNLL